VEVSLLCCELFTVNINLVTKENENVFVTQRTNEIKKLSRALHSSITKLLG
jgi:hypothetical protein